MQDIWAELKETWDGQFYIELSTKSDVIGPLTKAELYAIVEAIKEQFSDD